MELGSMVEEGYVRYLKDVDKDDGIKTNQTIYYQEVTFFFVSLTMTLLCSIFGQIYDQ